jgi:hypothetical protein
MVLPVEKVIGISKACVIVELQEPSISLSLIGGMGYMGRSWSCMKRGSIKQCVEPQLIRVVIEIELGRRGEERDICRELGSERVDVYIQKSLYAQCGVTQPSVCAEVGGLPTIFLNPWIPSC